MNQNPLTQLLRYGDRYTSGHTNVFLLNSVIVT